MLFITIDFKNSNKLFDYPKHLPVPIKGDIVRFQENYGRVKEVRHMTHNTVTEIRIICS